MARQPDRPITLTVKLTADELAVLNAAAKARKQRLEVAVRELAVECAINSEPKAAQVAYDLRLQGVPACSICFTNKNVKRRRHGVFRCDECEKQTSRPDHQPTQGDEDDDIPFG